MAEQGTVVESGTPADPALVREHLGHVLSSAEFSASPQLAAFLTYVVERKLEGADDRIKAYTIATEALGRPDSFDPQSDPIVRVQARRLRQALLAYYAMPDADDSVRITLPVGGYVPELRTYVHVVRHGGDRIDAPGIDPAAPVPKPSASSWLRRLAVATLAILLLAAGSAVGNYLPLIQTAWDQYNWRPPATEANPLGMPGLSIRVASERQIPGWFSTDQFVNGLEFNLSRFDEFVVMAPQYQQTPAAGDFRLDLDFTGITGTVLGTARLSKASSGRILWTQNFNVLQAPIGRYALLIPARQLASTLGQPYGVLYAQLLGDPDKTSAQSCLLKGYEWFQNPVKDDIEPARKCLEELLERHPGNHIAYILLGYLYAERFRTEMGPNPTADLARAYNMARRAIALRPQSAGSQQVMMEVQSARGNEELALEAGRKALDLNPNDSDVLADFGCRLIYRGQYDRGGTYADQAAE
ncbi:MAG: hypothetical protein KDK75_18095, partial [Alphaproteobacteria bacterium]|nr:hypothetical protein [Alphaproteobacteria bacterium]